jgi:hypothetical protein
MRNVWSEWFPCSTDFCMAWAKDIRFLRRNIWCRRRGKVGFRRVEVRIFWKGPYVSACVRNRVRSGALPFLILLFLLGLIRFDSEFDTQTGRHSCVETNTNSDKLGPLRILTISHPKKKLNQTYFPLISFNLNEIP